MNYFEYMANYIKTGGMGECLDMTKFTCKVNGTEQTFNDAMVALFQQSMQNNGTMGKVTFIDDSRKLYKSANACNHPALMVRMVDDFVKWPTVYGFDNGGAGQLSANGILATQYGVVDTTCIIQFDPPRESGEIYVSAKILE